MNVIGLVLIIIGGVVVFATALALSCIKADEEDSPGDCFDFFILGGLILGLRDLIAGIVNGFKRRPKEFPVLVLLGIGIALVIVGGILI